MLSKFFLSYAHEKGKNLLKYKSIHYTMIMEDMADWELHAASAKTSLSKFVSDRSMVKVIVISIDVTEEDRRSRQNFNASYDCTNYFHRELLYYQQNPLFANSFRPHSVYIVLLYYPRSPEGFDLFLA